MKDILSQSEIDALLDQVASVDEDTPARGQAAVGARTFDLAGQQRIVRGRLSGLESLNQRLAGRLRLNFAGLLQQDVDVAAQSITIQKYGDYMHSLYVPSSLNLISLLPLKGSALIVLDARLVFRMVDYFFGGSGRHSKIEGREFTETESRIVARLLEQLYRDIEEIWRGVLDFTCKPQGSELNPSMATIVGAGENVVVSAFKVNIGGAGGELQLVMPEAMLEPVRDSLDAILRGNNAESDRLWRNSIEHQLSRIVVEAHCRVAEKDLTLQELAALSVGDFIPLDMRRGSELTVEGVPVHRVRTGVYGGHWAVKIQKDQE